MITNEANWKIYACADRWMMEKKRGAFNRIDMKNGDFVESANLYAKMQTIDANASTATALNR